MRKSLTLALTLLGLFASLYLLWAYTSPSRPMLCFGTGSGCDAVRASIYSHFFGVPMPVFGVLGYGLVALLIIAESLVSPALALEVRYLLACVTGFGFLFSLYLEYLQGFVIHHFCTWCVTSGVVMTALCGLSVYNVVQPAPEADPKVRMAQLRDYFLVGLAAMVIGIPAFYYLSTHGEQPPPPPPPANDANADKLVRPDSHVAGNPDATVTVVEFGDLECPICGSEEPVARQVRGLYGKQIRFVFRQFPLAHTHPFSTRMAEASECAADQGKFWEALDEIYSRQEESASEQGLQRDAAAIGLDPAKFNQCMASHAEAPRVQRDHADGVALGVDSTPTFFIGRKPILDPPDLEAFSRLIKQALAAKGTSASSVPPAEAPSAPVSPPAETSNGSQPATSQKSAPSPGAAQTPPETFGGFGQSPGGLFSNSQPGAACSDNEAAMKQPELMNTSRLRELLAGKTKLLFVDVRPAKEYAAGKIPGAINIPPNDMAARWNTLPKDRVVVFYESGRAGDICAAARAAGRTLLANGYAYDRVKVYLDGLVGWQKSGLEPGK